MPNPNLQSDDSGFPVNSGKPNPVASPEATALWNKLSQQILGGLSGQPSPATVANQVPTTQAAGQANVNNSNQPPTQAIQTEQALIPNKRWQNPLGNFPSYTYQISLYMITPDAYDAFIASGRSDINAISNMAPGAVSMDAAESQATAQATRDATTSNNAPTRTMGGSPPSPSSANAPTTQYTNGAYLVAQSGGINNNTSKRAPGFDLDYYIDDLKMTQAINGKDTQSATNTFDMQFTITEPYGFSFVTKLRNAATELAKISKTKNIEDLKNPSKQFFILGIRFLGYDADGNIIDPTKVSAADGDPTGNAYGLYQRYYDIIITEMKFKIDGNTVVYNIKAANPATGSVFGTKRGMIDRGAVVQGKTVIDCLIGTGGGDNSNRGGGAGGISGNVGLLAKLNKDEQTLLENKSINIANEWDIAFLGSSLFSIPSASIVSKADLDKRKWAMGLVFTTDQVNIAASENATPDNTVRQISFSKGGPIIQCINDIIVQSSYLEDALKTIYVSSLTPDQLANAPAEIQSYKKTDIKWYNISAEIKVLGWDTKRKDFAYKTTYIIQEYQTPVITAPGVNNGAPYYGPHKRYEYWFTGKNSEILSYDQQMDNTFFNVAVSGKATTSASSGGGEDIGTKIGEQNAVKTGRLDVGLQAQNAYVTSLYDPGAYAAAKIRILGDPDFLMQPAASSINSLYNQFYGTDGFTVNPNGGQVFIEINFREPQDYDNRTGLMSINKSIQFWAYPNEIQAQIDARGGGVSYMVTKVNSSFSKGKFEQELECNINTFGAGATATASNAAAAGRPVDGSDNRFARQGNAAASLATDQTTGAQARTGVDLTNGAAAGGRGSINPGFPTTANGSASTSGVTGFAGLPTPTFLDPAQQAQLASINSVGSINNVLDPMQKLSQNTQGTIVAGIGGTPVASDDYMGR